MIPIIIYILISILLGIVSCLFGKKLYFPVLMLTVFSTVVTISFSLFDVTLSVGIITLIVGVITALLVRFFYKFGVFCLGSILGGSLSLFVVSVLPSAVAQHGWMIILLFMIVAGICAVKWCDFFIMASTSFNGAYTIVAPICFLVLEFRNLQNFIYADGMMSTIRNLNQYLSNQFAEENGMILFLLTLIIAFGGLSFQVMTNRKEKNDLDPQ